jgi:carbonic anhydrase/acetyltransferase-like protein (isoleucine patch superfamily)
MDGARVITWKNIQPKFGQDVFLASGSVVIGDVTLGDHSNVWFNAVIRGDVQSIKIGSFVNIQDNTTVHVTSGTGATTIGDYVTIGHNAVIHACTINSRCLIGMGSTILDGAVIPEESFVAAGSLVSPGKTFPSGYMIMGSPAKAVRLLTAEEKAFLAVSAKNYVDLAKTYRQ